jgi:hypothetical protein
LILQISNVEAANTNRSATLDTTTQIELSFECEQGRSRLQSAKTVFAQKSSGNLGERCSAGVPDFNKSLGRFVSVRDLKEVVGHPKWISTGFNSPLTALFCEAVSASFCGSAKARLSLSISTAH